MQTGTHLRKFYSFCPVKISLGFVIFAVAVSVLAAQASAQIAPPYISSISPCYGYQGTTVSATIYGSNLLGATSVTFSYLTGGAEGVTATIGSGGTASTLPITITIAANAALYARDITVTTPGGVYTTPYGYSDRLFMIMQAAPPMIRSLDPGAGAPGTTGSVKVHGERMLGASAVNFSGTGVTATVAISDDHTAYLNVMIAGDAPLGTRTVTIGNAYGTSASYTGFTVANMTTMPVTWKLRSYFNDIRTGGYYSGLSTDLVATKIYASHGNRNGSNSAKMSVYDIPTNT
jgi:hypothetical protein